jgi:hypothetical protein
MSQSDHVDFGAQFSEGYARGLAGVPPSHWAQTSAWILGNGERHRVGNFSFGRPGIIAILIGAPVATVGGGWVK